MMTVMYIGGLEEGAIKTAHFLVNKKRMKLKLEDWIRTHPLALINL